MPDFGIIRAPREILFGSGQRHALPALARRLGRRALVVTDARLAGDPALLDLLAALEREDRVIAVEDGTLPDVPVASLLAAAERQRGFAPDMVIGIGGGSCLDMAKGLALLLTHGGRPGDYYGEFKVPGPVLPVIALPTTAGTGSEVTPVAVLSDSEMVLKVGISSPHLIPWAAICDPDLTLTCPPGLTAVAGADALTHAIEALTATRRTPHPGLATERVFVGKNALSDQFALGAIALIWPNLERVCTEGEDAEARGNVMQGALLAGLAFGAAGTGAAHAIQYPVGALTHTPHGLGVACLMPHVLAWNAPEIGEELEAIAQAAGLASGHQVIPALSGLFARIGIPAGLAELGLPVERLDWVGEQALGITRLIQNTRRPLDAGGMRRLLAAAHAGDWAALDDAPARGRGVGA